MSPDAVGDGSEGEALHVEQMSGLEHVLAAFGAVDIGSRYATEDTFAQALDDFTAFEDGP